MKKCETWPEGYKEPEWLWRLEQDFPRPSGMSHIALFGAGVAFAVCGLSLINKEAAWSLSFGCLLYGFIFSGNKKPSQASLSDRPEAMLQKWMQQKARADAWAGIPWSEEKKSELKDCIKWSQGWNENKAYEKELKRKSSLWWRIIHSCFGVNLKPTPLISKSQAYEELLLQSIEATENHLRYLSTIAY